MTEPMRISPQEARKKIQSGSALLVCGYDDPAKFRTNHLEGAISYNEFISRLPAIPKDRQIIFYCA
jgi:rhodanese-related sulfurtransferase